MKTIVQGVMPAIALGLLAACSGTGEHSRSPHSQEQRPVYSHQNVDMRPNVSGEDYRDRSRPAPNAPYATTDAYPNDDGTRSPR